MDTRFASVCRAEKLKNRSGDDVRIGRFAGFDLFLRPSLYNTVEVLLRGKNSDPARVTDSALGTIRSLEATVQGFAYESRAAARACVCVCVCPAPKKLR